MAVVQDFYSNRRELGPAAVVSYLDAWLGERSSMNKRLMAQEDVDPAKLAEQEARLRRAVADLVALKEKGSQAETKATSDLAKTHLSGAWALARENASASAKRASALLGAESRLTESQARYRKRVADDLTVKDPDTLALIATTVGEVPPKAGDTAAAAQVTRPSGQPGVLGQRVDDLISRAGSDPSKRDAIVSEVIARYAAEGDNSTVKALTDRYAEGAPSWDVYMAKRHPDFTDEEHKAVLDEMKRVRAGGASTEPLALYKELADAGDGSTSTSTETSRSGPGDIDKQIADLTAAADDLAQQRHDAGRKKLFPRPNYMISNPNTYTDPREMRELRTWGALDAPYVGEVSDALARTGSFRGAQKEIEARGGASQRNEPVAADLLTDDSYDPGAELAQRWEGMTAGRVLGEGGWAYDLNSDGSIRTVKPDGKEGKVVKPGSKEHEAIVAELFGPGAAPDDVLALYAPALAYAKRGSWGVAADEARRVDPNDVRSTYAYALRKALKGEPVFSGVPKEEQIAKLSSSMGGKPGEHMRALLQQPMADHYATGRVAGALGTLADSMDAAPALEARRKLAEGEERQTGTAALKSGVESVSPDYARGRAQVEDVARRLREIDATPETLRVQLNAYGGAFDNTRGDFDRGVVDAVNDEVQATTIPNMQRPLPETSTDYAARPTETAALKLGAHPTPTVRTPDLELEAGGVSDDPDADRFDSFVDANLKGESTQDDPDADRFDSFVDTKLKEKP